MRVFYWLCRLPQSSSDFLGQAFLSATSRWKGELNPIYTYFNLCSTLIRYEFNGTIVEFGGGYSTVIFNHYLSKSDIQLISVDAYPVKYDRILNSSVNRKLFLNSISSYNKLTVNFEQASEGAQALIDQLSQHSEIDLVTALTDYITDPTLLTDIARNIKTKSILSFLLNHEHTVSEGSIYSSNSNSSFYDDCISEKITPSFNAIFFDCVIVTAAKKVYASSSARFIATQESTIIDA